jgi:hypothetical protein
MANKVKYVFGDSKWFGRCGDCKSTDFRYILNKPDGDEVIGVMCLGCKGCVYYVEEET